MQYLLIICHDDSFAPTDTLVTEILAWIDDVKTRGLRKYGNPLRPPADATTVRVREGQLLLKHGPFSKSKEQICAYELLECATVDEALEAASRHPMAKAATIEVRPVWAALTTSSSRAAPSAETGGSTERRSTALRGRA